MTENFDFQVFVNGTEINLFRAMATFIEERRKDDGHRYEIGTFDSDEPVQVEIRSSRSLSQTVILPQRSIPNAEIKKETIRFRLANHGTFIFEPEGFKETPLVLFFNPAEQNIPDAQDPHVKWFGPGEHKADRIELHSCETLYLAPGAVVDGYVEAAGNDIRICGRGILTQRSYPAKFKRNVLSFTHCQNLKIEGIITADPYLWNVVLRDCTDVVMDGFKICGGRVLNDDGVDICNSSNVVIRNCFIRSQDDCIAVKGVLDKIVFPVDNMEEKIASYFETEKRAVSNILIERTVFWCDAANVFRIGYECTAAAMENITVRNCDVVHLTNVCRSPEDYWTNTVWYLQPNHRMPMRNLIFDDIRIYVDVEDLVLIRAVLMECPPWVEFGSLENMIFRNIALQNVPDTFHGIISLAGHDDAHRIQGVRFENFTVNGKKITGSYPALQCNEFAEVPRFS